MPKHGISGWTVLCCRMQPLLLTMINVFVFTFVITDVLHEQKSFHALEEFNGVSKRCSSLLFLRWAHFTAHHLN